MWVKKNRKDLAEGNHSPIPNQIISNEEFVPFDQTPDQARVEHRINQLSTTYAKKLGMDRRTFLRTSGGMAVAFMAMNDVFGPYFDVHAAETTEADAYAELWPKNQFVFDVQTHHVADRKKFEPLFFRKWSGVFNKELEGVEPRPGDTKFVNYVKEVFFDSDASVACLSGVPSKLLDSINVDEMAEARDAVNALAGSERMICHGPWAPYLDDPLAEAERQAKELKVSAWKFYTGVYERDGEYPWLMDDEDVVYPFYEKIKELGVTTVCVHKGLPLPGSNVEYTHPRDIKKVSLDHPELDFIVYHSGFLPSNYDALTEEELAPLDASMILPPGDEFIGENGYLAWTTDLCQDRINNPGMTNVYMELGTTFAHTVTTHPNVCAHFLGQIIQAYGVDNVMFGTDSIWWGGPQWQIEAFRRFQIPEALQEEFGYAPITDEDKAKILGLNAARVYGIDVEAQRNQLPDDGLNRLKAMYLDEGGLPSNTQYGWVRSA